MLTKMSHTHNYVRRHHQLYDDRIKIRRALYVSIQHNSEQQRPRPLQVLLMFLPLKFLSYAENIRSYIPRV